MVTTGAIATVLPYMRAASAWPHATRLSPGARLLIRTMRPSCWPADRVVRPALPAASWWAWWRSLAASADEASWSPGSCGIRAREFRPLHAPDGAYRSDLHLEYLNSGAGAAPAPEARRADAPGGSWPSPARR